MKGNDTMKKLNELTVNEMVNGALENAKEKVSKSVKEKKPTFKGVQYNSKKIKVVFSKEMTETLSSYYATKQSLFEVASMYQNNIKVYQARLDSEFKAETPDEYVINEITSLMLKSQACYKFFKAKINKELKPVLALVSDDLYNAHIERFEKEDAFKSALADFFKAQKMELTDTMYGFIDKCIGVRSTGASRLNVGTIDNLNKGAFRRLLIDIVCQLALDKSVLSKVVMNETLDGTKEVEIKEFEDVTIINKPTYKTTIEQYKAIFDTVGVDYKGIKGKDNFVNLYNKSLKQGLFVEM